MSSQSAHESHGHSLYYTVWGLLLLVTVVEVVLAYLHLPLLAMLTLLMGLSIFKAGLIMAYFMHLRFERLSLTLTLIPALVMCIGLMMIAFPDSFRILELGR